MKNLILLAAGITFLAYKTPAEASPVEHHHHLNVVLKQDSVSSLATVYAINTKQLEAAGLVANSGTSKTKTLAKNLTDYFTKSNMELRALAKLKNIALPMTKPQGGMRPDGRTDSSPENMRDTSRNQSGTGEAGNTGMSVNTKKTDVSPSISDISKLKGAAFEQAYLNKLNSDINELNSVYEKLTQSKDSALKNFAKNQMLQLKRFAVR